MRVDGWSAVVFDTAKEELIDTLELTHLNRPKAIDLASYKRFYRTVIRSAYGTLCAREGKSLALERAGMSSNALIRLHFTISVTVGWKLITTRATALLTERPAALL